METNNIFYIDGMTITNSVESDSRLDISGYACHWNVANLNGEIVNKDSFNSFFSLYSNNRLTPSLTWEHLDTVIGGIDELSCDDAGLVMKAHINKDVKICNEMIIPNIIAGDINSFSTEGYILNGMNGITEKEDGYYVHDFILTAVSIVRTPADYDAKFTVKNYLEHNNYLKDNNLNQKFNPMLLLL